MSLFIKSSPWYLIEEGADAFKALDLLDDDVLLVSFPKCGTSFSHALVIALLRMNDRGEFERPESDQIGRRGQVYPDGVPLETRPAKSWFGKLLFRDLLQQERPRLFTSHVRADGLPDLEKGKKGRLIIVCRCPKDALVSMYHFRVKLNEDGRMSETTDWEYVYKNFVAEIDPKHLGKYAYGTYYDWYHDMAMLARKLGDRALFVFYEELKTDYKNQVERIAKFLGVPLTPEKLQSVMKYADFNTMKERKVYTVRKGSIREYENHLTPAHWETIDNLWRQKLGHLDEFKPLHPYIHPKPAANL